jgi:putative NIF3 family GTP cyclohydrolase 1 type 2
MGFLATVETALKVSGLRYYDAGRPVKRLVACGGAGGEQIYEAVKLGCDTCLTERSNITIGWTGRNWA